MAKFRGDAGQRLFLNSSEYPFPIQPRYLAESESRGCGNRFECWVNATPAAWRSLLENRLGLGCRRAAFRGLPSSFSRESAAPQYIREEVAAWPEAALEEQVAGRVA